MISRDGSYQGTLNLAKDLLLEFVPLMFEPREQQKPIFIQMAQMGFGGILLIGVSFAVPLAILFYPQIAKLRLYRHQHKLE